MLFLTCLWAVNGGENPAPTPPAHQSSPLVEQVRPAHVLATINVDSESLVLTQTEATETNGQRRAAISNSPSPTHRGLVLPVTIKPPLSDGVAQGTIRKQLTLSGKHFSSPRDDASSGMSLQGRLQVALEDGGSVSQTMPGRVLSPLDDAVSVTSASSSASRRRHQVYRASSRTRTPPNFLGVHAGSGIQTFESLYPNDLEFLINHNLMKVGPDGTQAPNWSAIKKFGPHNMRMKKALWWVKKFVVVSEKTSQMAQNAFFLMNLFPDVFGSYTDIFNKAGLGLGVVVFGLYPAMLELKKSIKKRSDTLKRLDEVSRHLQEFYPHPDADNAV